MREPFTRHARLLAGARRWEQAQQILELARERRRDDIRSALGDGASAEQIGRAFGLSARRVREIANEGGKPCGRHPQARRSLNGSASANGQRAARANAASRA